MGVHLVGLEAAAVVVVEAFVVAVHASLALAGLRVVKVAPEMNKMFVYTKKSKQKTFFKIFRNCKECSYRRGSNTNLF